MVMFDLTQAREALSRLYILTLHTTQHSAAMNLSQTTPLCHNTKTVKAFYKLRNNLLFGDIL